MEKPGSFSQKTRIGKGQTGAKIANRTDFKADLCQQMDADNVNYHSEKLGLGGHGLHEGWIKAEEASAASKITISPERRHEMIAVAAFFLAEKRGFAENGAAQDWTRAEAEIDARL